MVRNYFLDLYTEDVSNTAWGADAMFGSLSHSDMCLLNRSVTSKEIEGALMQMGAWKCPGPDGLPPSFFPKALGDCGSNGCAVCHTGFP